MTSWIPSNPAEGHILDLQLRLHHIPRRSTSSRQRRNNDTHPTHHVDNIDHETMPVNLTQCPVCSKPFRHTSFSVPLIQSVKAHIRAKARSCSIHRTFQQHVMTNPSNPSCPADGCNYRFSSLPLAWAHFIASTDAAHMQCKMQYVDAQDRRDDGGDPVARAAEMEAAAQRFRESMLYASAKSNAYESVKRLLNEGVDPNAGGEDGFTPLMTACEAGHVTVVEMLLGKHTGTVVTDDGNCQGTRQWLVPWRRHTQCGQEQRQRRCLLNVQNKYGQTALSLAAQNNRAGAVKVLLSAVGSDGPIDLTLLGNAQMTAAQVARRAGHMHVADLIADADRQRQVSMLMKVLQDRNNKVLTGRFDSMGDRLMALFDETDTARNNVTGGEKDDEDEYNLEDYEMNQCVICISEKVDSVVVPCWHAQYCGTCAKELDECAICRAKIERVQRIYLP